MRGAGEPVLENSLSESLPSRLEWGTKSKASSSKVSNHTHNRGSRNCRFSLLPEADSLPEKIRIAGFAVGHRAPAIELTNGSDSNCGLSLLNSSSPSSPLTKLVQVEGALASLLVSTLISKMSANLCRRPRHNQLSLNR